MHVVSNPVQSLAKLARNKSKSNFSTNIFKTLIPVVHCVLCIKIRFSATKQDRSLFLKAFFTHRKVQGVLAVQNGKICGYGASVPTGFPEKRQTKIGPIFAESWQIALELLGALVEQIEEQKQEYLTPYILETSKQFYQFIVENCRGQVCYTLDTLLTANGCDSVIDLQKCHVPHIHSCHIDI